MASPIFFGQRWMLIQDTISKYLDFYIFFFSLVFYFHIVAREAALPIFVAFLSFFAFYSILISLTVAATVLRYPH